MQNSAICMTLPLLFSGCRALPARARRQVLPRRSRWACRPRAAVPFSATGHVLALDPAIQSRTTQTINNNNNNLKKGGGAEAPWPPALSLPSVQPQIPPQPKCRLSAPRSRAARDAQVCHPLGNCARLQACRARLGDKQSGLCTWFGQRHPA